DYYSILGVSSDATLDDIRHAFYDICRRYHPDKVLINNNMQREEEEETLHLTKKKKMVNNKENNNIDNTTTSSTSDIDDNGGNGGSMSSSSSKCRRSGSSNYSLEHWTAIQTAWKCLSNDTKRIIYDIRREGRIINKDDSDKLLLLMREQANRDINNMQHEYNIILDKEIKRKGVIIKQALFGNLNRKKDNNNELEGPYINVTIPLQCAVDSHKVILAGGLAKADLPGFYNPIPLYKQQQEDNNKGEGGGGGGGMVTNACLYVLYEFKGKLHEVTVNEMEPLWLPLKAHAILNKDNINGPQQQQEKEEQKEDGDGDSSILVDDESGINNNNGWLSMVMGAAGVRGNNDDGKLAFDEIGKYKIPPEAGFPPKGKFMLKVYEVTEGGEGEGNKDDKGVGVGGFKGVQ
ncbi:hypothetical protein FOL47_011141, partial [Perkinsus chesapeaki]